MEVQATCISFALGKRVGNEAVPGLYMGKDCITHWNQQIIRSENCARDEEGHGAKARSKVSLDDSDQGVVRRTFIPLYYVNKV